MSLEQMKKDLCHDYKIKFKAMEEIAFKLHQLKEPEIEMAVIKKLAGLKMMIDHIDK